MSETDYVVHLDPLVGAGELLDVQAVIETADHPWWNQTLVQVGDVLVRLGVFEPGEYHWHQHDEQDELFLVLDGAIRIELEGDRSVDLGPRQLYSVPSGTQHRPVVQVPSSVLMMEQAGVVPAGD